MFSRNNFQLLSLLKDGFLFLQLPDDAGRVLSSGRPKCNSLLHLFGPWLFEAALINCNLQASPVTQHSE